MGQVEGVVLGASQFECFLCRPSDELVYARSLDSYALCGLGPIVPAYSVVASMNHIGSASDALKEAPGLLSFAHNIRSTLTERFGSCVMTEHGRVPVCVDISGMTDVHCYHAHFLLFPAAPPVEDRAAHYFAKIFSASTLLEALSVAAEFEDYFLVSDSGHSYKVMTRPTKVIRQFSRLLISDALGCPERANWRKFPERERASASAQELRSAFPGNGVQS